MGLVPQLPYVLVCQVAAKALLKRRHTSVELGLELPVLRLLNLLERRVYVRKPALVAVLLGEPADQVRGLLRECLAELVFERVDRRVDVPMFLRLGVFASAF